MTQPAAERGPTRPELALAAGITLKQVVRDLRAGAPKTSTEEYLAWRAANRRPYARRGTGGDVAESNGEVRYSVGEETARLRRAQAEQAELANAEKRRELVSTEDVMQLLLRIGAIFKSQLEAQPGRLANELAAVSDPALIRAKLRDENRRILDACAVEVDRFAEQIEAPAEADGSDAAPSTGPHPGPMGGRDADPAAGQRGAGTVPQ